MPEALGSSHMDLLDAAKVAIDPHKQASKVFNSRTQLRKLGSALSLTLIDDHGDPVQVLGSKRGNKKRVENAHSHPTPNERRRQLFHTTSRPSSVVTKILPISVRNF